MADLQNKTISMTYGNLIAIIFGVFSLTGGYLNLQGTDSNIQKQLDVTVVDIEQNILALRNEHEEMVKDFEHELEVLDQRLDKKIRVLNYLESEIHSIEIELASR